jgi:hypothetical protein
VIPHESAHSKGWDHGEGTPETYPAAPGILISQKVREVSTSRNSAGSPDRVAWSASNNPNNTEIRVQFSAQTTLKRGYREDSVVHHMSYSP